MGDFQDEDRYLFVFKGVNNPIVTNPNAVVSINAAARPIKVLKLLVAMWLRFLSQALYLFKKSILHLSRNAF